MANKKITDYSELTAPVATDFMELVDVSDTTDSAAGSSFKVKPANIITKAHGLADGVQKVASGVMTTGDIDLTTDVTGILPVANFTTGTPNGSKFVRDDGVLTAVGGGGDALTSNPLSQFASTTSLQLKGVLSDETGSGAAVFATSPALVTPTGIVKGDVGLGNVDNTSDATKNAAAVTLTNKTLTAPVINSPTGITKTDVGLSNVTNNAQYFAGGTDVAIADGGTGASTATAGFDALSPMTTAGDLIYGGASGTRTRLPIGTTLQVLRTNAGATAPEWATISSGGQSPYDAIVAASGGDYTTLGAALAAASNGWSIYVKEGTYTESAITCSLTNIHIVGENRENAVIDLGTTTCAFSGAGTKVENLGVIMSSGRINFDAARCVMKDCKIVNSGITASGSGVVGFGSSSGYATFMGNYYQSTHVTARSTPLFRSAGGSGTIISNNVFIINTESTSAAGISLVDQATFSDNRVESSANISAGLGIVVGGQFTVIANNRFTGFGALAYTIKLNSVDATITGNNMAPGDSGLRAIYDASGGPNMITSNLIGPGGASCYGIFLDAGNSVVSNNYIENTSATSSFGIYVESARDNNVITGNLISTVGTGIQINASSNDNNTVTSNNFISCTTNIVDNGLTTNLRDNQGVPVTLEKSYMLMKNTSGSTINAGNVVTLKAVAAGNEVITTTTASDNLVFGMATAAISNNASGYIQVIGKTTLLTVDGTTDIAIGDFLTTFTSAGIARKAAAGTLGTTPGDLAFAIALEAYTTNDSSGVVDALLIKPIRL